MYYPNTNMYTILDYFINKKNRIIIYTNYNNYINMSIKKQQRNKYKFSRKNMKMMESKSNHIKQSISLVKTFNIYFKQISNR